MREKETLSSVRHRLTLEGLLDGGNVAGVPLHERRALLHKSLGRGLVAVAGKEPHVVVRLVGKEGLGAAQAREMRDDERREGTGGIQDT